MALRSAGHHDIVPLSAFLVAAGVALLCVSRQRRRRKAVGRRPKMVQVERLAESPLLLTPASPRSLRERRAQVHTIVLTGGPCAGKTSALSRISNFLRQRGFSVFVVPEAATLLFCGGISVEDLASRESRLEFQASLLRTQMLLEDACIGMAEQRGGRSVIICDRGAMDGSAYMDPLEWDILLQRLNLSTVGLREGRYDAIVHLITAAQGAEAFYSSDTNSVRTESLDEARELDKRTQRAWAGHPHLSVVDNRPGTDFENKMQKATKIVARVVGLPSTVRHFSKFLCSSFPSPADLPADAVVSEFSVEKVYLRPGVGGIGDGDSDDDEGVPGSGGVSYSFVRSRIPLGSHAGTVSYGHTYVKKLPNGDELERKRILSPLSFRYLVEMHRDPGRRVVKQRRLCCLWQRRYFEMIRYEGEGDAGLTTVRVQRTDEEEEIGKGSDAICTLPPFVRANIGAEITHDPRYSAFFLSLPPEKRPAVLEPGMDGWGE